MSLGYRLFSTTIRVQPLLILDLNGILCHRDRKKKKSRPGGVPGVLRRFTGIVAQTPIIPRTDLLLFLHFLDCHFCLAIWSSAKPKTAKILLDLLLL